MVPAHLGMPVWEQNPQVPPPWHSSGQSCSIRNLYHVQAFPDFKAISSHIHPFQVISFNFQVISTSSPYRLLLAMLCYLQLFFGPFQTMAIIPSHFSTLSVIPEQFSNVWKIHGFSLFYYIMRSLAGIPRSIWCALRCKAPH